MKLISLLFLIVYPSFFQMEEGILEDKKPPELREIEDGEKGLLLDIHYATTDNFTGEKLYKCPRCFLRKEVADALLRAQQMLQEKGYGLKIFDCYRPHGVQKRMWKILPDRHYVANPSKGSMHNRGQAVDLTLVDRAGKTLDMGTDYDYFGKRAFWSYTQLPSSVLYRRQLLKEAMKAAGFHPIRTEWWHFSIRHLPGSRIYSWEWDCK